MEAARSVEAEQGDFDTVTDLAAMRRELQASRDREMLLRNELAHRVRNVLALTRSLFSRTVDNADTLEHAANHFHGRLAALARYHGHTASSPQAELDLEAMVFDELLTVARAGSTRISVTGPTVRLRDSAAEMIGLALHELVINSIKFGALAQEEGSARLRVSWTLDDAVLAFEWAESGVAIVTPAPIGSGFGREFIEQALPFQLGAETSFDIVPGGLITRIRLPFPAQATGEGIPGATGYDR